MLQASSPAASFLQSLNTNAHPRSASFGDETSASAATNGDVRRTRSLRGRDMVGLSSFGAAGEDLAGGDGSSVADSSSAMGSPPPPTTVPAAARHPLFAHHAQPPAHPPCGAGGYDAGVSGYANAQAALGHGAPGFSAAAAALGHTSPPLHPHAHRALSTPAGSGSGFPYANNGMHEETFIDSPPMSPAESISSGGGPFSPASAFLSHFSASAPSSHAGPAQPLPPDAEGAHVKDYILGKFLARGGFSTVRLATNTKTGEVVACKIVRRDDLSDESGSVQRFEDELRVWQSLPKHRYIVPLLDMHRIPVATFLFMPFIPGGSLLDALMREGGSEETARKYFSGVVMAVAVLHEGFEGFEGNMMHGDLKLDNFLVDSAGGLRLGDFGMSERVEPVPPPPPPQPKSHFGAHLQPRSRISSAPTGSPGGTRSSRSPHRARRDTIGGSGADCEPLPAPCPSASLPYACPELLCAPPSPPSLAQDIWAIGVILHALLTGRLPFVDSFDPRLQMKILRGQWDPPDAGYEWIEALRGCLERDVRRRWDIKRIRQCDAVSGWRSVKAKSKTRSRSRTRVAVDHSIEIAHEIAHTKGHPAHHPLGNVHSHSHHHHHHSISRDDGGLSPAHAGRGRRSRSGFRGGRPNSYPSPSDPDYSGHSRTHSQHDGYASQERSRSGTRGDSPVASRGRPRSALDLDLTYDPRGRGSANSSAGHSPAGSRSRSRSRPNLAVRTDMRDVPHQRDIHANARAATSSGAHADALVPDLEGMNITRGRSTQRNHPSQSDRRSPSSSSLLVPDFSFVGHEARGTSRSPSAPRGGFGRGDHSTGMTPSHPHNVTFTESPPSSSAPTSGAHTPAATTAPMDRDRRTTRSRTRRDGVQVPVPGSGPPTPGSRSTSRHRGSPGGWETRPPTLGMELDAVDEEGKARRGRSPGRQRSRSRGRML